MKVQEITESAVATTSSSIAPVSTALGSVITRQPQSQPLHKYTADATPMTPQEIKRYKNHAVGRFENSIGQ